MNNTVQYSTLQFSVHLVTTLNGCKSRMIMAKIPKSFLRSCMAAVVSVTGPSGNICEEVKLIVINSEQRPLSNQQSAFTNEL